MPNTAENSGGKQQALLGIVLLLITSIAFIGFLSARSGSAKKAEATPTPRTTKPATGSTGSALSSGAAGSPANGNTGMKKVPAITNPAKTATKSVATEAKKAETTAPRKNPKLKSGEVDERVRKLLGKP